MLRSLLTCSLVALVAVPSARLSSELRTLDANHSSVGFSVPIMGGLSQVTGKFTGFEVNIDYDAEQPERSSVYAVIEVKTVDTGIDERDRHLQSADFFDADEHPEITFESGKVEVAEDGLLVHGTLSLRGVDKDVTLAVEVSGSDEATGYVGFTAQMVIDRLDFGVEYQHSSLPSFVGNEVTITIHALSKVAR